ncbi:hypothetical protein H0O02_04215 [Candidatus Micrarchaeota archaeon]|nr:hypothetical protein [Candidatus Micrarchaeota archaeon]
MASDNVKNAAVIIIIVAVLALSYSLVLQPQTPAVFEKGAEVNQETFLSLLSDADKIYIVMDIRNASNSIVSTNILQCGVDFAGSRGLAGRNVSYVSMDDNGCALSINEKGVTDTVPNCIRMLNGAEGISLYIYEGSETKYYTKAAAIGVNGNYQLGTCELR